VDIFPIFRDPAAFEALIANFLDHLSSHTIPSLQGGKIDVIVALDARGFLLGPIVASRLKAAFAPVRKIGKLPGECVSAEFEKEYGKVKSFSRWFELI
jgi:adenine phosphoribosyltransferase